MYAIFGSALLLTCFAAYTQQNNNWYFGKKAALTFNSSGSQPVPSVLADCVVSASEAAASISDKNGKLLFYTNGVDVYNKQHKLMLNGANLRGNISACQTLIIPYPGNDSLYYIFYTDAVENNLAGGYRYAVVNMKRDNGKGEVITKDVLLYASCTERMAAVRHADGINVWVITNDFSSNTFRAWLINCNGLQSAVVSTVGEVLNLDRDQNAGLLKASPDGKLLCQTHFPYTESGPTLVQLFDFDNLTGVLSNARSIMNAGAQYMHCAFSPDSKLLYLSRPYNKRIDQYRVDLPGLPSILASRQVFTTLKGYYDIELAPDEKIYLSSNGTMLGVINLPNIPGPGCNLLEDQVDLTPGGASLGFPSHINDITNYNDPNNGFTYTILDNCAGRVQFNAHSVMAGTVSWEWDFGDGNTSAAQNPVNVFTPPNGAYTVRLRITSSLSCGEIYKTAIVKPSGSDVPRTDFDFVVRCDSGYVRFINKTPNLSTMSGTLTWYFGDGNTSTDINPLHTYLLPGSYPVRLQLTTGTPCLDNQKTLPVEVKDFTVVAPPDQTILVGRSVFLSTASPGMNYAWSPAKWLSDSSVRSPVATPLEDITYTITASNGDGCIGKDSIRIHVLQYGDIYVPSAFTPNNDGKNDDIKPFFPGNYELKEFSIFDRSGQKVFTTSKRGVGWNGELSGSLKGTDVYVWMVKVIENHTGEKIERQGTFVLIR